MTRFLNLSGRTFLLILPAIAALLATAHATGVLRASVLQTSAASILLAIGLARGISYFQISSWRQLSEAVLMSERTGRFVPDFPMNSPVAEVNRQAAALNAAAHSVARSQASLDNAYLQFVETMAQALDARDPYTAGHSLRVADYSYTLAVELGVPEMEAQTIRMAAQLHDIGKIGIPDAILQKPGRLSPDEYGLIKLHPQIGRKILEKVARFEQLLSVVELHHENHDGSGYPFGLAGQNLPIAARIVHVADSFDAMTTTRSYRPALSLRAAIQEIERNSGSQFDPQVARVFLRLIADGRVEIGDLKLPVSRETGLELREHAAG
jgi:HD-GYP domain-containing protein (c-di-GMP phosphodiesterase class II)